MVANGAADGIPVEIVGDVAGVDRLVNEDRVSLIQGEKLFLGRLVVLVVVGYEHFVHREVFSWLEIGLNTGSERVV